MNVDPNILIVIGTVVAIFALSSVIAAWTERRVAWSALISLIIGIGLLVFVHQTSSDGLAPRDIPDAFIAVAAYIL